MKYNNRFLNELASVASQILQTQENKVFVDKSTQTQTAEQDLCTETTQSNTKKRKIVSVKDNEETNIESKKQKQENSQTLSEYCDTLQKNVGDFMNEVFYWDSVFPNFYAPENLDNVEVIKCIKHKHCCYRTKQIGFYKNKQCCIIGNVKINTTASNSSVATISNVDSVEVEFNFYYDNKNKISPTFQSKLISNQEKQTYINLWKKFENTSVEGDHFDGCNSCSSIKSLKTLEYDKQHTLKPFIVKDPSKLPIDVFLKNPSTFFYSNEKSIMKFNVDEMFFNINIVFYDAYKKTIKQSIKDIKPSKLCINEIYSYEMNKDLQETSKHNQNDITVFIPYCTQINCEENTKETFFEPSKQPLKTIIFNTGYFDGFLNQFHTIGHLIQNYTDSEITDEKINNALDHILKITFYPHGIFPYNNNLNTTDMKKLITKIYLSAKDCAQAKELCDTNSDAAKKIGFYLADKKFIY